MTEREKLVELMAEAIWPDAFETSTIGQMAAIVRCRNALTALEAAGVRLVPGEATWAMVQAAHGTGTDRAFDLMPPEWHDAYNAMLAASPYAPEAEG